GGSNRRTSPPGQSPHAATPGRKEEKDPSPPDQSQQGSKPPIECLKCKSK
ncbi:hypothetical protein L916_10124, partial [Phytophthora nicotianae]